MRGRLPLKLLPAPIPFVRAPIQLVQAALYLAATLAFLRSYILGTTFYLDLPAYLAGRERLPFQARILPAFFLNLFYRSPALMARFTHPDGLFSAAHAPFFFLSLLALALAACFLQKLYRTLTRTHTCAALVYPLFLFALSMTYAPRLEQNFSYPYDLLSVAFFTASLYFIYTRQFLPLAAVLLLGTLNRETTLFLIPLYLLDAAHTPSADTPSADTASGRFNLRHLPWSRTILLRATLLTTLWIALKLTLHHLFRHNDATESHLRLSQNLHTHPGLLPALLNLCGYLLPVVWILRARIRPRRFGRYIYILPLWFAVMLLTGILVEVRIYGELASYAALASILLLEDAAATRAAPPPIPETS